MHANTTSQQYSQEEDTKAKSTYVVHEATKKKLCEMANSSEISEICELCEIRESTENREIRGTRGFSGQNFEAPGNSARGNELSSETIEKASYLVDQALASSLTPLEVFKHPNYPRAKKAYATFNRLAYVRWLSLTVLLLMPFLKEPEWCHSGTHDHCKESKKYLLSGINYVSATTSLIIEFLCVLPLIVSLCLQRYCKRVTFWDDKWTWLKVGLLCVLGIHMISSLCQISGLSLFQTEQIGLYLFVLTPIFFSDSLRKCFLRTIRIGQSYVDTAVLLVGVILMSAWLANLLFHEPNFENYSTSLLSLFVMVTTVNNPNVWAPTYEGNHLAFIFFFCYMAVTFFFLIPILFALIYKNYKIQLSLDLHEHKLSQTTTLRTAFDLLCLRGNAISYRNARRLFLEIGSSRRMRGVGIIVDHILPDARNRENDENIGFGEFHVHCTRFVKAVEEREEDRLVTRRHRQRWFFLTEDFLQSRGYQAFSFAATLASFVIAILDHNARDPDFPHVSHHLAGGVMLSLEVLTIFEFLLGWLFLADLILRIYIQGIKEFSESFMNCFDFVATTVIISLQISTIWHPHAYTWISISIVVRSLRYLTLLGYFDRLRFMGHSVVSLIPAAAPIFAFHFCVCSLFSVAGVNIFGGMVYVGNPRLADTDYAADGLWVYNYNDHMSAMITSFNLCIVNNWYVFMDGYAAAAASKWARLFFISFWAVAVMFTLNVVVAFLVAAFTTQMERAKQVQSVYLMGSPSRGSSIKKLGTTLFRGHSSRYSKRYEIIGDVVSS